MKQGSGGVGGGVGIAFGLGEVALSVHRLLAGSATLKTVEDISEAVMAARDEPLVRITEAEREGLDKAAKELSSLVKRVKKNHDGLNGTKAASGTVATVGGGLTIAGIFFPPLLIAGPPLLMAGVAVSAVGASCSFVASMFDLTSKHKKKLVDIMDELAKFSIVVVTQNTSGAQRQRGRRCCDRAADKH